MSVPGVTLLPAERTAALGSQRSPAWGAPVDLVRDIGDIPPVRDVHDGSSKTDSYAIRI